MSQSDTYVREHGTAAEIAAEYRAVESGMPTDLQYLSAHRIVEACLEGPLMGAMREIGRWRNMWCHVVQTDVDFDTMGEISLHAEVTPRGNLAIRWQPMVTEQQMRDAPMHFGHWLAILSMQPICNRRDDELYYIKDFVGFSSVRASELDDPHLARLHRIEVAALHRLLADLPVLLSPFVRAYWQDVLVVERVATGMRRYSQPDSVHLEDAWSYRRRVATRACEWSLSEIGTDADGLRRAIEAAGANDRIRTDQGLERAAARALGTTVAKVANARRAVKEAGRWPDEQPGDWFDRQKIYR